MKVKKTKTATVATLLRIKPALLRKVEKAAREQSRSRNAEACLRLEASFKRKPELET